MRNVLELRRNQQGTVKAWENGKPFGERGDSIWTDGDGIYSYATWIVCCDFSAMCEEFCWTWNGDYWTCDQCSDYWCANGPRYLFNATKYSTTTTIHQNAIRAYMESEGYSLKVYDKEPRGTTRTRVGEVR
tara:strand:+ start:251 stop:643 length:393 start_codon:yes stop_codon:yes gene_type:complete